MRQQRRWSSQRFLAGGHSQCGSLGRSRVRCNPHSRIDGSKTVGVASDYDNLQALTVELMCKGPANAAAGAGDENNGFHGMPCEIGVSK